MTIRHWDDEWWTRHREQLHELVGAKVTAVSSEFDEETLRLEKEDGQIVDVRAIYGAGYGFLGVKERAE